MPRKPFDYEKAFWEKVDKSGDCWIWQGAKTYGYGVLTIRKKTCRAHRVSYEWAKGPIPEGLVLDHLCRNPPCVNPDHLEAVTTRENLLRGEGFVAKQARQDKCVNGHPFTEENTYRHKGHRYCRKCRAEVWRAWFRRSKAAT